MQLHLHKNRQQNAISACDQRGICVAGSLYPCSLLLGPDCLHANWPVHSLAQIDLASLQPVLDARPNILLIGTGRQQQLPDLNLLQALLQHNIVAEFMPTAAACRTFNILLDEQRSVMAALIWQADNSSDPAAGHCA